MVSSSEPSVNQTLYLRSIIAFQDRLTFLNRHMTNVDLLGFFDFVKFTENISLLVI